MAISRNPILARYHMLKALALRRRPSDLARTLRSDTQRAAAAGSISPAAAWEVYKRYPRVSCFADNGWLVQFGVHSFSGPERFHFSLVRQTNSLEHWNDELHQVELLLLHEPTPALRALGTWSRWSFAYANPAAFFAACEAAPELQPVLRDTSCGWS
jgi:hypothetical protein